MRRVWTFFYGSFMNPEVLAKADVRPTESQMARLDGWDIKIAPRATLVPSEEKSVFGVLAQLSHADLEKLYTKDWFGFGTYLPEAVLVETIDQTWLPALCYLAPAMAPRPAANSSVKVRASRIRFVNSCIPMASSRLR